MRRLFMRCRIIATIQRHFLDPVQQYLAGQFQTVDLFLLFANDIVQLLYRVFLKRQFGFDLDQTLFAHNIQDL